MRFTQNLLFIVLLITAFGIFIWRNKLTVTTNTPIIKLNDLRQKDAFLSENRSKILVWSERCAKSYCPGARTFFMRVHRRCGRKCVFFHDQELLSQADAVIFTPFERKFIDLKYPSRTNSRQLFIFYEREPPTKYPQNASLPASYFNAIATYHSNADIPIPYGRYIPIDTKVPFASFRAELQRKVEKMKTKGTFIVYSNCNTKSKREEVIKELQKYIRIDVFGKCNNNTCDKQCFERKTKNYRFYLAFENAYCDDYVTEKFWKFNEVVPVVLKRRYYPDLHPKSFIALDDFKSIKAAADYLEYLQWSRSAYLSHLEWTYGYTRHFMSGEAAICRVCNYVHQRNGTTKLYNRIEQYQNVHNTCDFNGSDTLYQ
ncbi:unnamed protein product [Bursaphelenchus okinawaensis]|uniref:Fucosyltransferase n=1 Tax=Bursaphelenchus okinawaensis TaxID=465554 RepID=A0A811L880_9BILA|nr:unnamed protein product [Bursaphelenchus okinawaensis]CAG9117605.1 unnamed protein product [Bursaphelenchus okinawaensis]